MDFLQFFSLKKRIILYKPVNPKADFPAQENTVLKFWKEHDIFKKSVSQREGCEEFVFYDGPPFATGLPHFGHFIPSTIKDIIPRYQTMKGKKVERRFGWDCHGLPVENLIEKELGLNSKHEIEGYGIANFNEKCKDSVVGRRLFLENLWGYEQSFFGAKSGS